MSIVKIIASIAAFALAIEFGWWLLQVKFAIGKWTLGLLGVPEEFAYYIVYAMLGLFLLQLILGIYTHISSKNRSED